MVKIIYAQGNTVLVDWEEKTSLFIFCATVGIGNTNTRQNPSFVNNKSQQLFFKF